MQIVTDIRATVTDDVWRDGFGDQRLVITYGFATALPDHQSDIQDEAFRDSFSAHSAAAKTTAREAFQMWEDASALNFVEVAPEDADIVLGLFDFDATAATSAIDGFAFFPGESKIAGDVFINESASTSLSLYLHEIGHSLGLEHIFEGDFIVPEELNTRNFSVMSSSGPNADALRDFDIEAIQFMYGPPEDTPEAVIPEIGYSNAFTTRRGFFTSIQELAYGDTGTVTIDVGNFGEDPFGGGINAVLVLSKDETLSSDDFVIGSTRIGDLQPNEQVTNVAINYELFDSVPVSETTDDYFVLVALDPTNEVAETRELDNVQTLTQTTVTGEPGSNPGDTPAPFEVDPRDEDRESDVPTVDPDDPPTEDPADPPVDDPTDPPADDPADPADEDPSDPVGEDPTDPVGDDPVDPVGDDPTDPEEETPTDPTDETPEDPVDPVGEDPSTPTDDEPTDPTSDDPTGDETPAPTGDPTEPETPADPIDPNAPTNDDDEISGTNGADEIKALDGADLVTGLGGADILQGGAGDDTLVGNGGGDTLSGNGGRDQLSGGGGSDDLQGGGGADSLLGNGGRDTLNGGGGGDELDGGGGRDLLQGGGGNDALSGGGGRDELDGGGGRDTMDGGGGRDDILGGRGSDILTGGGGADRFVFDRGNGRDTVTDFQQGQDKIVIQGGADDFDDIGISQQGDDVMLRISNTRVLIEDDQVANFDDSDFIF